MTNVDEQTLDDAVRVLANEIKGIHPQHWGSAADDVAQRFDIPYENLVDAFEDRYRRA